VKFVLVVGARPNFMKAAPVFEALSARGVDVVLVHTGQHFDRGMSEVFFDVLGLPEPYAHLGVGAGSRVEQFAGVVAGLGRILARLRGCRVLVVGDVTSTAAAAAAADACDVPVSHIEAGLRSFDLSMPEERNRRVADALSDLLFVTEPSGAANLLAEGKPREAIHLVGNVMIDTLIKFRARAEERAPWAALGLDRHSYAVATVHRPSNVDGPQALRQVVEILVEAARRMPVVFPVHPRTRAQLECAGVDLETDGVMLTAPMDYLSFLGLLLGARAVLTDSGGLQEESTALDVPCLTLRENTERPVTLVENGGTSVLVGRDLAKAAEQLDVITEGGFPHGQCPEFWDGNAGRRIAGVLVDGQLDLGDAEPPR
jgi:UDP-N-acetylglucosamine 2-epimerase (non-hydrolysing)